MTDLDAAARWVGRITPGGPALNPADAAAAVEACRQAANSAYDLAVRSSWMSAALEAAGPASHDPARVLIVDRATWTAAAARSFVALAGDAMPTGLGNAAQLASALGVMSTRVLGQYDPYAGNDLLLVAPNLVATSRQIGADLPDFALWVAVHEQTHQLQFAAAPWLADHLRSGSRQLLASLIQRTTIGPGELGRALRSGRGLFEAALDAEQRHQLDALTAVMSLLEGHADVSMDAVPITRIRSRARMRRAFERRRSTGGFAAVLRRALGIEAKYDQYRDGARFVRAVRKAGRGALDVVWQDARALPTLAEIADPAAWLRRVAP